MPVAKKLPAAKMVHAVAKPKRTPMVPTLVTSVSRLDVEPTIIVQKPKNFVTTKQTNATELTVLHILIVTKRMVSKNVKLTNVSKLIVTPTNTVVTWASAKQTHAQLSNARPMVTVPLHQSVETKSVKPSDVQITKTVTILTSHIAREISVSQCQEFWTLSTKLIK